MTTTLVLTVMAYLVHFQNIRICIASKCPVVSREGEASRHTEILVFSVSPIRIGNGNGPAAVLL